MPRNERLRAYAHAATAAENSFVDFGIPHLSTEAAIATKRQPPRFPLWRSEEQNTSNICKDTVN
ncbi:MAG TPA: hypothetical protein VHC20_05025 [Candidatus Paceibacterota bacterium]|nr:hypothetical protein [Candidatus Paceibacterota bacterium]